MNLLTAITSPSLKQDLSALERVNDLSLTHVQDNAQLRHILSRGKLVHFDIILLEHWFDGQDSRSLIETIRQFSDIPVIMLSLHTGQHKAGTIINAGADDFITGSTGIDELVLRIKKLSGRTTRMRFHSTLLQEGLLVLDTQSHRVMIGTRPVHLTATEYRILLHLLLHKGIEVSSEDLARNALPKHPYITYNSVRLPTHITNLRKKLGDTVRIRAGNQGGYMLT